VRLSSFYCFISTGSSRRRFVFYFTAHARRSLTMGTSTRLLALALLLAACASPPPDRTPEPRPATVPATARANPLADTVNAYRARHGLQRIPVSAQLGRVAAAHAADLEANYRKNARCNMHSWSTRGDWTPCCYTEDHAQKECMWNKPREITGGAYAATGYEIVAWHSEPIDPARALEIWKGSPGHHAMIRNLAQWSDNTWMAVGAAQSEHYAVVWFGEQADPTP
jgi:uncharacterized protein YkwD